MSVEHMCSTRDHEGEDDASVKEVFEGLSEPIRREVIHVLLQSSESMSTDAVVEQIDFSVSDLDRDYTHENLKTVLCHRHFPTLVQYGLLSWDRKNGTIEYCGPEFVDGILQIVEAQYEK